VVVFTFGEVVVAVDPLRLVERSVEEHGQFVQHGVHHHFAVGERVVLGPQHGGDVRLPWLSTARPARGQQVR
jgi:hypothetical protein